MERSRQALDLASLAKMETGELVNTKPRCLIIDGKRIEAATWTDVSVNFIKFLLSEGVLTPAMLPFCPDPGTEKCYVNNKKSHPVPEMDGSFKPVAENIFVDVKWNAKSHILKIKKSLEKLGISTKYDIRIELDA